MHSQTIISLRDLRRIAIECPSCGAVTILDMTNKSPMARMHRFFAPRKCEACIAEFDNSLKQAIDDFQRAFELLNGMGGDHITFHISATDEPNAGQ